MIEFSKSGKWFAIYIKKDQILSIFDSTDIHQCFSDIENQKPKFTKKFDDEQFDKAQQIVFGKADKYMAIVSKTQVTIMSLE